MCKRLHSEHASFLLFNTFLENDNFNKVYNPLSTFYSIKEYIERQILYMAVLVLTLNIVQNSVHTIHSKHSTQRFTLYAKYCTHCTLYTED